MKFCEIFRSFELVKYKNSNDIFLKTQRRCVEGVMSSKGYVVWLERSDVITMLGLADLRLNSFLTCELTTRLK